MTGFFTSRELIVCAYAAHNWRSVADTHLPRCAHAYVIDLPFLCSGENPHALSPRTQIRNTPGVSVCVRLHAYSLVSVTIYAHAQQVPELQGCVVSVLYQSIKRL